MPLALTLGLLAGLLEFIPNIGPILAAVPAVLLAYTKSPTPALWVVVLHILIQVLESYVIHEASGRRSVHVTPDDRLIAAKRTY